MVSERIVKKHVAIIHAYSHMSVIQRKIINVLLHEAIQEKNNYISSSSVAIECRIPLSRVRHAIQFNSNRTQYLKESIDNLASLKIEWNLLKDKVPSNISFLNLRILQGSPTFYDDNTFNFSFHKIMLEFVNQPSIYGAINLDLQSQFESKYSHSLYENCTRFASLHKNKIIAMDLFRKLLGVDEHKYKNMKELTRNVISPALQEVNDRADFKVNLDPIKTGRKCVAFELNVSAKQKLVPSKMPSRLLNSDLENDIKTTFGHVSHEILIKIINHYDDTYILEKINYTKKYAKQNEMGFYPLPYLMSALKHDYQMKQKPNTNEKNTELTDQSWHEVLTKLQTELSHWKRILSYAETVKHEDRMKETTQMIRTVEEKIRLHYLTHTREKRSS